MRKAVRDRKYMDWVRKQPCVRTGSRAEWGEVVHAHHVRLNSGAGMSQKPSDYRCVPLTAIEHNSLHAMGEKRYWAHIGLDPDRLVICLMTNYLKNVVGLNGRLVVEHMEKLLEEYR